MKDFDMNITNILAHARLLATSDAAYYEVAYVFRQDATGNTTPYCAITEWPQTLPAQLAAKDQEIAELRAQLSRLTAAAMVMPPSDDPPDDYACDQCGKTFDSERKRNLHVAAAHVPDDPQTCGTCGKTFKNARAFLMHQQRAGHQPAQTSEAPTRQIVTLQPIDDDPTWRCATCNSDAFSRSMADPTRCMRCVKATNGVAA